MQALERTNKMLDLGAGQRRLPQAVTDDRGDDRGNDGKITEGEWMRFRPPRLPEEVDGVFVGGGHNSLVTAAYLARAGLEVLVLEAGDQLGGGVATEECTLPLFRHNLHAFFVRWTPDYRVWHDLALDRFGVRAIYPEPERPAVRRRRARPGYLS